ncbi:patatin-like phospholipase family protein [Marinifilum sp. D714]|uniref:patatin-like phospholipase family protein n=1 Tax=Marinifilum sp. D714 TaxID=2937523 RepID=UPI0027CDBECE|nr:patatin-like phospholipase family protein [Marinifilum sp. D714]MDQ2180245.1 patatin-like phospholipase family protein [Marinifilum sp. D714]
MKKISLVLSGGGARGIAHIGVLEELEKQGYEIHSITGTSMGAVVGGIYAAGKIKEFKKWILDLNKIDIFKLVDFTLFNSGFIRGDKVFEELSTFIPDYQIQDLPIKFSATATDLIGKNEVLFTDGSLYNAMRASIAIPNVLTPVKNEGSILVDGGVVNNIPINHAQRIDDDLLIAVNVNADIPLPKKKKKKEERHSFYQSTINKFNKNLSELFSGNKNNDLSYFDIMNVSFEIMRNEMVKFSLKNNPPDILIETSRYSCNVYDFYKADELIEMGCKATIISINNYNET